MNLQMWSPLQERKPRHEQVDHGEIVIENLGSHFTLANKKGETEDRRHLQGSLINFKE